MSKSSLEVVTLWLAGDVDGSAPIAALASRQDVFTMTRQAQDTVISPVDTGAWSHALRAAFAARIALANNNPYLADIYAQIAAGTSFAALVASDYVPSDPVEQVVVTFMDKVANNTKAVEADDIIALQKAGVADADIVRLCELNAFLAYQIRVAAGLASLIEGERV